MELRMPQKSTPYPLDVVLTYHRTWTGGGIDQAMTLVSDDFICQAPGGSLGNGAYRDYLANFVSGLIGVVGVTQFVDGDHVALIYYPQTAASATTPAAEYFTIRDGLIATSLLMFDRRSYAPPAAESGS
jgi:SnoaL-like domain